MSMIPPAAYLVVIRYALSWGFLWLLHHGWVESAVPDDVLDASAQIVLGALGAIGVVGFGVWRERRLFIDHVRAFTRMRGIRAIHADPAVVADLQAQGVPNVVASPPNPV